ncbi:hypothetical protein [Sphingobium olei]|uniref:Uncharacterized protein n=1 Tax=Sphingobium olei TaxID=420955 RepID=A0ABW3NXN0_9SPHN|nr:hypothetical protein [Sphingobium sp.]
MSDDFDPAFVDFDAYLKGRYTPPPELVALPDWQLISTGWGGKGFGIEELDDRARASAGVAKP